MELLLWTDSNQPAMSTESLTQEEIRFLRTIHRGFAFEQSCKVQFLMKEAVRRMTGTMPEIFRTEHGAPYVKGEYIFVSASHTRNVCAGAASHYPLGIDAEKIQQPRSAAVRRFFSERERDFLADCQDPSFWFTQIWTLKEAYGKMTGRGLPGASGIEFGNNREGKLWCSDPTVVLHSFRENGYLISSVEKTRE